MFIQNFIDLTKNIYKEREAVNLHEPVFVGNEKKYLVDCIDSTYVSSIGPYINRFESAIKDYTRIKYGCAVVNGTAGLQIGVKLVGVKAGEEVLTQALSFVATANAIRYNGADPVFIDVDEDTLSMSPKALLNFLKKNVKIDNKVPVNKISGKRIAACIPMHTFGFVARMKEIKTICSEFNIPIIEDAAEALGSFDKHGNSAGSYGEIGVFSFNGNKIITTGGGGCIVGNNDSLIRNGKHLITTAKKDHEWEYYHDELGYNYRLPNINAALGLAQIEHIEEYKANKADIFLRYQDGLSSFNLISPPETTHNWNYWLISIQLNNKKEQLNFLKETNNQGIKTRPIWSLLYKLPMYEKCIRDNQKTAKHLESTIVNIPSGVTI